MPALSLVTRRLTVLDAVGASTVMLPQFDPVLGTLMAVRVSLDGTVSGSLALENMEARTTAVSITLPAGLTLALPSGAVLGTAASNAQTQLARTSLAAFDGAADFVGAPGVTLDELAARFSNQSVTTDSASLAALVGSGEVALSLSGALWLRAAGGANVRLATAVRVMTPTCP